MPYAEYTGSTTAPAQRYVHGLSIDDPVAWFSGSSVSAASKKHLRANHQGSIVAVTNSSGSLLDNPRYDVWGKPESDHSLRFGYTGQAWMKDIGLWYYKARMFHPEIGRFLQTDPVGYEDQMNLYAYVHNDPINLVDPDGRETFAISGNFNMGIVTGVTYGLNLVVDNQGNLAVQVVGGAGVDFFGASLTVNAEVTNAETLYALEQKGYQIGVDAGEGIVVEGAAIGGEGYEGLTLGGGPGVGAPVGASALTTETATLFSVNIPSFIEKVEQLIEDPMSLFGDE